MAKDDKIEVEGKVLKSLPWAQFEVELPEEFSNMVIRAYVGGKMQKHLIRLIPGDSVVVELTPYDLTRGRIVFRKQTQKQTYKWSGKSGSNKRR